ncbi:MAG: hypothetical protein ACYDDA_00420 [Acidiferrobacteraceae bacterium]
MLDASHPSFSHCELPDCSAPIVSHYAGLIGIHGTGFFVSRGTRLLFLTAKHCLGGAHTSYADVASHLLIPYRSDPSGRIPDSDLVRFTEVSFAQCPSLESELLKDGDLDIALLPVCEMKSASKHQHLMSRAAMLPPTGNWLEEHIAEARRGDFLSYIRFSVSGFPTHGTATEVDYDSSNLTVQGAHLQASYAGTGDYPHTVRCKFDEDAGPIQNLDGLSGAPVFVHYGTKPERRYALAGMMIRGNYPNGQFVTVRWFTDLANQLLS